MRKVFIILALLIFFISCRKNNSSDQQASQCKLTKMIQGTHNGQAYDTTTLFYYDNDSKITHVTDTGAGYAWSDYADLKYDGKGRLIQIASKYIKPVNFKYNDNGSLLEIQYYGVMQDSAKIVFQYGTSSEYPVGCAQYSQHLGQWSGGITRKYTWQNGNMVQYEDKSGNKYNVEYYDNLTNNTPNDVLFGYGHIYMGMYDEFTFFNKNKMRRKTDPYSGSYFKYELDAGRITKMVNYLLKAPAFTDTTNVYTRFYYYYDCP